MHFYVLMIRTHKYKLNNYLNSLKFFLLFFCVISEHGYSKIVKGDQSLRIMKSIKFNNAILASLYKIIIFPFTKLMNHSVKHK